MKFQMLGVLVFSALLTFCTCGDFMNPIKTVELKTWSVSSPDIINNASVDIPNGIYSFGEKLSLIQNVLQNNNDEQTKWIATKPWTFVYEFSGEDLYNRNNIELIFDGVDTIAEVKLNDVVLGKMENMFRQYIFDIKKYIKEDNNTLQVSFEPPVEVALKRFSANEIPPKCSPHNFKGDCHVNFLRKVQASFGSPTAPSVPSIGFWKSARIEAYRESVLREVLTRVENINSSFWRLHIDAYLATNAQKRIYGRIALHFNGIPVDTIAYSIDVQPNEFGEMIWYKYLDFNKTKVKSWFPAGYGSSKLHNLTVDYYTSDLREATQKSKMIGFRDIKLVQDEIGEGRNFYFTVNNIPIFAKGLNLMPLSVYPEEIENRKLMRQLIQDAIDSNMNMIRVWGGGYYLPDYFYSLADKAGILIWQDFMFTTSLYPSDGEFLTNTLEEVRYQLKRIYSHPCLALFSANYEVEQALAENWYNVVNKNLYVEDYKKLFVETIKNEFDRLTKGSGNFVFSSPTNGWQSENDGYVSQDPNSEFFGDVHYFHNDENPLNTSNYPIPRFASAYGVQSLPCVESILKQASSKSDLNINSVFLTHREQSNDIYATMRKNVESFLDLPSSIENFDETLVFYSQIVQALGLKLQTEHFRTHRSFLTADERGMTMGALYWHMNDVWVAPTLSGIDYYGRWKMAQYLIRDAFANVIITGTVVKDVLKVFVVSDLSSTNYNINARIQVFNWTSFEALHDIKFEVTVLAHESELIRSVNITELFESFNGSLSECFFYLTLEKNGDLLAPENYVFPTSLKETTIPPHFVTVNSITQLPYQNIYEIELSAKTISTFVWLDAHNLDGKFSENGFLMIKPTKSVYFYPAKNYKASEILNNIVVTHSHQPKTYPSSSFSFKQNIQNVLMIISLFQLFNIFLL